MSESAENAENAGSDMDPQTLASLFDEGLGLYDNLGRIDEPTNSAGVQVNEDTNVQRAIRILEDTTRLVSLSNMFSTNEEIEEVPTENLRYFLLPALLGGLCLKLTSRNRKEVTELAEVYYKDFLKRCRHYGLSDYEVPESNTSPTDSVTEKPEKTQFEGLRQAVYTRANKIQRFKEQKELQRKLADLKQILANTHVDEEIKRDYFLTMIKLFISEAVDELSSIESEKQILQHMASLNQDDRPRSKRPPPPPLKPVIITKDAVQKAIFGAGYPSLPVMSVEEFYEKRVSEGIFPGPNSQKSSSVSLQDASSADVDLRDQAEAEEMENRLEEEDPDLLQQMRERDDFKDDHRRGWGNRMNRS